MTKVSVSIDETDLRWLKRRARRLYAGNLSAVFTEGARLLRHNEALGALLDRLGAPALSDRDRQELDAELAERPRPRRRRGGRG